MRRDANANSTIVGRLDNDDADADAADKRCKVEMLALCNDGTLESFLSVVDTL